MEFRMALLYQDSLPTGSSGKWKLDKFSVMLTNLWQSTGIYDLTRQTFTNFSSTWQLGLGRCLMMMIGILLLYLAIFKEFEPLLLLPIGFGAVLANIPLAGIAGPHGILGIVYSAGIENGIFPLIIFMGVGAMTDFGPLIANPKTALLVRGQKTSGLINSILIDLFMLKKPYGALLHHVEHAASRPRAASPPPPG